MPRVSVVIPTYNRSREVARAIRSALAQTFADREIIVVDDGSTDDTAAVVASFGTAVKYMRIANSGPAAARNRGIDAAAGEFVAFLDSDDTWHPEKLALQVAAFDRFGAAAEVCFADARAVGDPGRTRSFFAENSYDPGADVALVDDTIALVMLRKQPILLPTVMVRREALSGQGAFDEALRVAEDTDLIFRLAIVTKYCVVNKVLADFDVSQTRAVSLSKVVRKDPSVRLAAEEKLYARFLAGLDGRRVEAKAEVRARLAGVLSRHATIYVKQGRKGDARQALKTAAGLKPGLKVFVKLGLSFVWPSLFVYISNQTDRA